MRIRVSRQPVLTPALVLVVASVAALAPLHLSGYRPGGFAWLAMALVAGFSLSGSV